jgi:hypothetical protein
MYVGSPGWGPNNKPTVKNAPFRGGRVGERGGGVGYRRGHVDPDPDLT